MNETHKGKASMASGPVYAGKWKVTVTDKGTGSIMDVDRPNQNPYSQRTGEIGPQSKTDFGKDKE